MVRAAAMFYDECTPDKLLFHILALTGEKIEKAIDFQSREHETQVSTCTEKASHLHDVYIVLLAQPTTHLEVGRRLGQRDYMMYM